MAKKRKTALGIEDESGGLNEALSIIEKARLENSTKLDLSGLGLDTLPGPVRDLISLKSLKLSNNNLTVLPEWLKDFTELETLHIELNKISVLPEWIENLVKLKELKAFQNEFTALPESLGKLGKLKSLHLQHNKLSTLPRNFANLNHLAWLSLSNNKFKELPQSLGELDSLESLWIHHNQFKTLPQAVGLLKHLKEVWCQDNENLIFPPRDIVELGAAATVSYLRSIGVGAEVVWESKMLLVGEGQAGKTWLYEALNGRFQGGKRKDDKGTIGIEIGTLELPHPTETKVTMRLNTWDFAGQEINHATHQFFFSNRTLFLLAWSARAGLTAGKVEKWLKNIRDRAPEARIILIATQWDSPHNEYAREELKRNFPQIKETIEVSSETGEGVEQLRTMISVNAAELSMMGLRWPSTWRKAAQEIRNIRTHTPHTTLSSILQKLKPHGLGDGESRLLLRWLHELGEVLHFLEPPELAGRIVLDPQWVTRHVGQVLASRRVEKDKGFVTRECLAEVWKEHEQPVHDFLLALMEAFDLAYRIPDDPKERSLVVERLPEDAIDYSEKWKPKEGEPELHLRLRLESLHPGIPTWFIARCHRFTQGLHWRRGVLFGDDPKSPRHLGLVVANEYDRTVDFTVRGPFPFTFMPLLRDGFFATVERRYPGLKIQKKVPCPGKRRDKTRCTHEFTLEELEGLIAPKFQGDERILTWICVQCRTKHRVHDLLCGIGFAPLSGEITLSQLSEMLSSEGMKTRSHMDDKFAEMQRWWQLEFVRQWNTEQKIETQSCPTVMAIYPLDGGSLLHSPKLRVQLYCMHPGCWHSLGDDGKCEFAPMRQGIVQAGAFLSKWAGWLKPAAALIGAAVPVAGGAMGIAEGVGKSLKEELELTEKALEQLEKLPTTSKLPPESAGKESRLPTQKENTELRGLKDFLDAIDFPVKPYGGLKRVLTPEEHVLWLCPRHYDEFTLRA